MSFIYSFILLITSFFIQVSVLGNIRIFGIVPDVLLVLIVYFSFFRNIKNAIFLALFFGFLFDIFFSSTFGFYATFFFITAWVSGLLSKEGKSISLSKILVVIGASTFLIQSILMVFSVYFEEVPFAGTVMLYLLLQIGVNVGLGALIFNPIRRFFEILNRQDSYSKQRVRI